MDGERVFKVGSGNDLILTEHGGVQPEFPKWRIIPPLYPEAGLYCAAGETRILLRGERKGTVCDMPEPRYAQLNYLIENSRHRPQAAAQPSSRLHQ